MNKRIKSIRESLNLSQEEMGKAIGLTRSGISNIESGQRAVSERHVKLLHSAFNVNEHWLRTGEGEMFNPTNTSLDALAAANNIDPVTRAIVEGLIEMPAQAREAFIDLIFDISDRIRNSDYEAAKPEAVAATASKYFKNFNAAKAENPPEEDRRDLQEPHTV